MIMVKFEHVENILTVQYRLDLNVDLPTVLNTAWYFTLDSIKVEIWFVLVSDFFFFLSLTKYLFSSCECSFSYEWISVSRTCGHETVLDSCYVCPLPKYCLWENMFVCINSHGYKFIPYFSILFYMYVINYIKCLVSVLCVYEESSSHACPVLY